MQEISVPRGVLARLEGHARAWHPDESCALLLGRGRKVSDAFLTDNARRSPASFAIPDGQLLAGYAEAGRRGLEIAGIFHSHPGSAAVPSETDAEFMEMNPVPWVIYSGTGGDFRAFVLDGRPREIAISRT